MTHLGTGDEDLHGPDGTHRWTSANRRRMREHLTRHTLLDRLLKRSRRSTPTQEDEHER